MDRQTFEALVERLEAESHENPERYRRRVLWMARMGYGYIALVVTLAVGLVVGTLFLGMYKPAILVKAGIYWLIPLVGFLKVIGATLFTRLEAPEGLELREEEHPELFRVIEETRRELDAPKIDAVLLTEELNAAVSEIPRFGIVGPAERYLILGLPLLQALTPQEFQAVLAHEFGHLAGAHSRQSGGMYQLRRTWERIREHFEARDESPFMFGIFFDRFIPRFMAYSFVLARADEYEADRASAQVTSPQVAAQALTRVSLAAHQLNSGFWPSMFARMKSTREAPRSLYVELNDWLGQLPSAEASSEEVFEVLRREKTDLIDTHPALMDRLAALGGSLEPLADVEVSAASHYLSEGVHRELCEMLSLRWLHDNAGAWERRHTEIGQELEELAHLRESAEQRELSLEEHWALAQLLMRHAPAEEAELAFEQILERWPTQQGARMTLGTRWVDRDDARGIALLEAAIADDIWLTGDAGECLYAYYRRQGDAEMAGRWADRLDVWFHDMAEARREREELTRHDVLFAHDFHAEEIEEIQQALGSMPGVKAAWLVGKEAALFPEEHCYVLGVHIKRTLFRSRPKVTLRELGLGEVAPKRDVLILDVGDSGLGWARKMFKRVGGSQVF